MDTLSEVIHELPTAALVAVWINQFNGLVEKNGKSFEQSDICNQNKDRIRSISYFPRRRPDMEHDVSEMLKARMTFDWAMRIPTFSILERPRLHGRDHERGAVKVAALVSESTVRMVLNKRRRAGKRFGK